MATVHTPSGLDAYLHAQVRHIAKHLSGPLSVKAIHKARVATRRVQACLDLVEPLVRPSSIRQLAKRSRKLRTRLGEIRELDVILKQLVSARRKYTSLGPLIDHVRSERGVLSTSLQQKKRDWKQIQIGKALKEELKDLRRELPSLERDRLLAELKTFSGHAKRVAKQPAMCDPHALRTCAKRLRYQLEIADELGMQGAATLANRLAHFQDALGDWHDAMVLVRRVVEHIAQHPELGPNMRTLNALMGFVKGQLSVASAAMKKMRDQWHTSGDTLKQRVRDLGELPIKRSKAGRNRPRKR